MSDVLRWVLWNGMLAVIPVVLAYVMYKVAYMNAPKAFRYLLLAIMAPVWFVFLPNTCYLLTEWRHFLFTLDRNDLYLQTRINPSVYLPLFAMSTFYACYSGFGMLMFALAVRPIERLLARVGLPIWAWAVPFFATVSLGVYLGLVLRFNSWDPINRLGPIWNATREALSRSMLAAFILCFGIFLWIAYEALDIWIDAAAARWQRFTGRNADQKPSLRKLDQ